VALKLIVEDAFVVIEVTDNGKGFPAEGRQRLLEPYMTTREGGTGLGLAIVSKVLEEHGGGIELNDNPEGRGGQVRMRLPREVGRQDGQNIEPGAGGERTRSAAPDARDGTTMDKNTEGAMEARRVAEMQP
jgi:two-component system nitrogen regulation sensor histidine kinase NtrY